MSLYDLDPNYYKEPAKPARGHSYRDRPEQRQTFDQPAGKITERSLLDYLRFRTGVEAAGTVSGFLQGMLGSDSDRRGKMLRQLEIIEKKKSLGLPLGDEDYEHTVNKEKPFENPGDSITLATSLFRHKNSPVLNLGSLAGLATRGKNVSRISKYLGL